MRKLASIQKVNDVHGIPNADAIEVAVINGWKTVVKKNSFQKDDLGIYFEIDSFLPASDPRFEFLKNFITYNNTLGSRLRTIRLRGQISQGLLLPLSEFPEVKDLNVGDDVTEILNIQKWEPAIPAQLAGKVRGNFPNFIQKTDQERVQNLDSDFFSANQGHEYETTIKLDGSSMTIYVNGDDFGVCSRNLNLYETEDNSLWQVARKEGIIDALQFLQKQFSDNFAFQGEIIGEGIQGNPEKIKGQTFYLFDVFDIDKQEYLSSDDRLNLVKHLNTNGFNIKHVPVLEPLILNHTVDDLLGMADGPSLNAKNREGLVFKRKDGKNSFKVISNWYLEKFSDR